MSGETDLAALLAGLRPVLESVEFAFATLPPGRALPAGLRPIGTFDEPEGLTVIAPAADLAAHGVAHSPGWAMIRLRVHSALSAVGLTAAVATALTRAGISANVVAAYHHDHVFVQWARRDEALEILSALSRTGD